MQWCLSVTCRHCSDFTPTVDNKPPSKQNTRTGTVSGVIVGLGLLGLFAGAVIFIIRKSSKGYTDDEGSDNNTRKPLSLNIIFQMGSYFYCCRASKYGRKALHFYVL